MTNDNISITSTEMVEAPIRLDAVYDEAGNLIPNPTQEDWEKFTQREEDISVDVSNTRH